MASLVRVLARLALRDEGDDPQGLTLRRRPKALKRFHRGDAAGALARQVSDLVDALLRHRPQQRVQSAERFADTGRRLGQQRAAGCRSPVDDLRQLTLSRSKRPRWKGQLRQRRIAALAVQRLLPGPVQKLLASGNEGVLQVQCRADLVQRDFGFAFEVEVDQRQRDLLSAAVSTKQGAVGFKLSPLQVRCARILIPGIEILHMIRKGQLGTIKEKASNVANQLYSLAF